MSTPELDNNDYYQKHQFVFLQEVSIKVELQFLVRRFKDDRNEMIHSGFDSYNKKWKSNSYLSAVIAICNLMKKLDGIYSETIPAGSVAIVE